MPVYSPIVTIAATLALTAFMPAHAGDGPRLDGITEIAAPGVPGPLVLAASNAVVLAAGESGGLLAPAVAALPVGKGRLVAFGHTGYADCPASGQTDKLMRSAIEWAGRRGAGANPPRIAVLDRGWQNGLKKLDVNAELLSGDWRDSLARFDVICLSQSPRSDAEIASLQHFVREGGGVLAAGLGWGWLQLNAGRDLSEHPLNRLCGPLGVYWADGTLDRTSDAGFRIGAASEFLNAARALDAILAHDRGEKKLQEADLSQAGATLTLAARTLANDDALLARLTSLLDERVSELAPSESKPLRAEQPLLRLLLALQLRTIESSPAVEVRAHLAAADFPGAVAAEAPRLDREMRIKPAKPGWNGTGLYAPPGEVIVIETAAPGPEWRVRIGAHTDALWHHNEWKRVPEVSRSWPLAATETRVASAFGGPIYIEIPERGTGAEVTLRVRGAVEMPRYVHGATTRAQWLELRQAPAPWAELESSKIVLTIPARVVRALDNPEDVMTYWDELADAHATLATIPLERMRAERFVADVQISAGYMHSGYPIMTHLDVSELYVDLSKLRAGQAWGFFHELGHNHQEGDWTFDGTGEVTCNLFALHAIDTICRPAPGDRGHDAVNRPPSVVKHIAAGAPFERWKRDPFLALQMYVQLQREFGWDAFRRVFAAYRDLPAAQRPRNDAEKRDQWMVRFSRTVGRNLGPFFQKWGVPTSDEARQSIADLPEWLPAELRPAP